MPKLKYNQFKGVNLQTDENMLSPEFWRGSVNLKSHLTYIEVDPKRLEQASIPNPNTEFGIYGYNFSWETGIYGVLSNDKFRETSNIPSTTNKHNVLILIAKAYKDGKYHRLIYLKSFTNNPSGYWSELSLYGLGGAINIVNHEPAALGQDRFPNSFFSTEKDGQAFIKIDRGIAKIYLPHNTFWVGRLNRRVKYYNNGMVGDSGLKLTDVDQWYIDQLVEAYDPSNVDVIPTLLSNYYKCAPNRRLGWTGSIEISEDVNLEDNEISWSTRQAGSTDWWDETTHYGHYTKWTIPLNIRPEVSSGKKVAVYPLEGFLDTGDPCPSTVPYVDNIRESSYNDQFLYGFKINWAHHNGTGSGNWTYSEPYGIGIPERFFDYYLPLDSNGEIIAKADLESHGWKVVNGSTPDKQDYMVIDSDKNSLYFGASPYWIGTQFANTYGNSLYCKPISDLWNLSTSVPIMKFKYLGPASGITSEDPYRFDPLTQKEFSIIVTGLLDDRDEVLLKVYNQVIPNEQVNPYAIKVSGLVVPHADMNFRLTRIRYYLKFKDDPDYDLVKEHDFLEWVNKEGPIPREFTIHKLKRSDIYLSTNIGYLVDEEKLTDYKVLMGFKSIAIKDRISVGVTTDDDNNIYYNVVGGGNIQSDMIIKGNRLPIGNATSIVKAFPLSNVIGLSTDKELLIIKPSEVAGQLVFEVQDTLEYGVKDINDIAEMKGAVILHTKKGIFVTDGYKTKLLSAPINAYIESNYSTANIRYNPVLHELYYYPGIDESFWRYRFDYDLWESQNLMLGGVINPSGGTTGNIQDILPEVDGSLSTNLNDQLVDFNGENAYLQSDKLWIRTSSSYINITYALLGAETDLGAPDIDKLINYIDIDFVGTVRVHYMLDGTYVGYLSTTTEAQRKSQWLYMPLANRKPFKKIRLLIEFVGSTSKLYSMEIDFNPLKRRRI